MTFLERLASIAAARDAASATPPAKRLAVCRVAAIDRRGEEHYGPWHPIAEYEIAARDVLRLRVEGLRAWVEKR